MRIFLYSFFPKTRVCVCGHSSSELKQGKNAFATTSRGVIGTVRIRIKQKQREKRRDELISLAGTGDNLCRRGGERKRKMF